MSNDIFGVIKKDLALLETELLASMVSPVELITEIGTHLVKSGGKRLRPALYLLSARSGPVFDASRVIPLAAALELIHMASLVHDDVIDHADTRRGTLTANAKWGNQVSILSGDYIFAKAFSLVAGNSYDSRITTRLSELVCDLSSGEIIQNRGIYVAARDIEAYYGRIAKKTANFLAVCCEMGAIVSEMDEDTMHRLYTYGYSIGMAFQITDDLLDITSSKKKIGKPAGNDILQGIVTLPVIRALETSPDKQELEAIITNRGMTEEMLQRALKIVKESDGITFAQGRADNFLETARKSLPGTLPEKIRQAYCKAADFIGHRDF